MTQARRAGLWSCSSISCQNGSSIRAMLVVHNFGAARQPVAGDAALRRGGFRGFAPPRCRRGFAATAGAGASAGHVRPPGSQMRRAPDSFDSAFSKAVDLGKQARRQATRTPTSGDIADGLLAGARSSTGCTRVSPQRCALPGLHAGRALRKGGWPSWKWLMDELASEKCSTSTPDRRQRRSGLFMKTNAMTCAVRCVARL